MSARVMALASAGFESARYLETCPDADRRRRLHGHNFVAQVRVAVPSRYGNSGFAVDRVASTLSSSVAPLRFSLLNEAIPDPTECRLAAWVWGLLDLPDIDSVAVSSTNNEGAYLVTDGYPVLWQCFRFEAAHQLPNVPADHKCGRMHGHGFEVVLHARQVSTDSASALGSGYLALAWEPLHAQLHHHCLNEVAGLENPTSEMIAGWIWTRIQPYLPELSLVTVYETATAGCHFNGVSYRIWKDFTFESALRITGPDDDEPLCRLHGHSYLARIHLSTALDDVLGWTVDYGDVKARFQPIHAMLDHHRLDEIDGLSSPDMVSLAMWIRERISGVLSQVLQVDLFQTTDCGVSIVGTSPTPPPSHIRPSTL